MHILIFEFCSKMGLDLIPRVDGEVVDADSTSVVELYKVVGSTYLLLTEFEVHTVSYGPTFFPFAYGSSAKRVGHKTTGKYEDS